MSRDRRSEVRATAMLNVLTDGDGDNGNICFFTDIVNISVHGLKCLSYVDVDVERVMAVTANIDDEVFRLVGKTRWCVKEGDHYSCGVLLDPEDSEDFQEWQRFVESDSFTNLVSGNE